MQTKKHVFIGWIDRVSTWTRSFADNLGAVSTAIVLLCMRVQFPGRLPLYLSTTTSSVAHALWACALASCINTHQEMRRRRTHPYSYALENIMSSWVYSVSAIGREVSRGELGGSTAPLFSEATRVILAEYSIRNYLCVEIAHTVWWQRFKALQNTDHLWECSDVGGLCHLVKLVWLECNVSERLSLGRNSLERIIREFKVTLPQGKAFKLSCNDAHWCSKPSS